MKKTLMSILFLVGISLNTSLFAEYNYDVINKNGEQITSFYLSKNNEIIYKVNSSEGDYYIKGGEKLDTYKGVGYFKYGTTNNNYSYLASDISNSILPTYNYFIINGVKSKRYDEIIIYHNGKYEPIIYSDDGLQYAYIVKENKKYSAIINGKEEKLKNFDKISKLQFSPDGKSYSYIGKIGKNSFIIKDGEYFTMYNPKYKLALLLGGEQKEEEYLINSYWSILDLFYSPNSEELIFSVLEHSDTTNYKSNIYKNGEKIHYKNNGKSGIDYLTPKFSPDGKTFLYKTTFDFLPHHPTDSKNFLVINGKRTFSFDNIQGIQYTEDNKLLYIEEELERKLTYPNGKEYLAKLATKHISSIVNYNGNKGKKYIKILGEMIEGEYKYFQFTNDNKLIYKGINEKGLFFTKNGEEFNNYFHIGKSYINLDDIWYIAKNDNSKGKDILVKNNVEIDKGDRIFNLIFSKDKKNYAYIKVVDKKSFLYINGIKVNSFNKAQSLLSIIRIPPDNINTVFSNDGNYIYLLNGTNLIKLYLLEDKNNIVVNNSNKYVKSDIIKDKIYNSQNKVNNTDKNKSNPKIDKLLNKIFIKIDKRGDAKAKLVYQGLIKRIEILANKAKTDKNKDLLNYIKEKVLEKIK